MPLRTAIAVLFALASVGAGSGGGPARAAQPALVHCRILRVDLRAYALGSNQLRYRGLHVQQLEGHVQRMEDRFTDAESRTVLRAVTRYRAADLTPVDYEMHLPLTGHAEWLHKEGDRVVLRVRAQASASIESDTLPLTPHAQFAATLPLYMLRHWDALMAGQRLDVSLLVPSRTDRYAFHLLHEAESPAGGPGRVVIRMDSDSLLVRQVVDPVRFVFESRPPHRLLETRGRTPIRDEDGAVQRLRIEYHYRDGCLTGGPDASAEKPPATTPDTATSR
ncbi:MAG TPA: hypothetical protein VKB51_04575 [bacterium]|nr:hypothetical protein [bacterium]